MKQKETPQLSREIGHSIDATASSEPIATHSDDICELEAGEIAEKVRSGVISPVNVVEAALTRQAEIDPQLHAWARSAQKWYRFPNDANVLQESAVGEGHGKKRNK